MSPGAAASWNYLKPACSVTDGPVQVSYDMNRLMRLTGPERFVVTLNASDRVDEATVLRRMVYEHPVCTPESLAAQRELPGLDDGRTAFAGAHHGWGFHEDGCASGVRAAEHFGDPASPSRTTWPRGWPGRASPSGGGCSCSQRACWATCSTR